MSDGDIDQAEIDRLTRLFDALGLDRPELDGQFHASGEKDLTRLRTAGAPAPGYAIPRPPPDEAAQRCRRRPGSGADQGPACGIRAGSVLPRPDLHRRRHQAPRPPSLLAQTRQRIRAAVSPGWMCRTASS